MLSLQSKVRWWAIYSRGFVIMLQILFHLLIPDHEPSDTFSWVKTHLPSSTPYDTVSDEFVSFACDGLIRWDAHHFLHVANNGYTFEHSLAFFPLYPLLVQTLARTANWFIADLDVMTYPALLKICAVYINFILFVIAADVVYTLSRRVLRDEYLAYKSALFFCLNPASVFFTAPYSETTFALFSFWSMLILERGMSINGGMFLALASAARANGVVNVGFVIYNSMKTVATETILYVRAKKKLSTTKKNKDAKPPKDYDPWQLLNNVVGLAVFPGMVNLILGLAPFAAFQWYCYTTFCQSDSKQLLKFPDSISAAAEKHGYVMPGNDTFPSWCQNDPPIAYSFIQQHYWKVGPFNYWETKQLPQFVLAAPIAIMIFWQFLVFFSTHYRYVLRLGLVDNTALGLAKPRDPPMTVSLSLPRPCFVYLVHAIFLVLFGFICMHVQVTTRMIMSSSPVPYWIAALVTTPAEKDLVPMEAKPKEEEKKERWRVWVKVEKPINLDTRHSTILLQETSGEIGNWVKLYFLGYLLIGTILFSNHYPWT